MKPSLVAVLFTVLVLSGCMSGPAISKSTTGSLDVHVTAPPDIDVHLARISIDGVFIGNVSRDLPVLFLKRGKRKVTVELAGMKPYQQDIEILGDPNHQFLEVRFERE